MARITRILAPALLLGSLSLMADDKEAPKFTGGDLNKYWADACSRCHGTTGNGRDNSGKQLPDAGFDFTEARKANKKKDADWIKITLEGKDKMPAFKGKMTEADVQKMITEVLRKFAAK